MNKTHDLVVQTQQYIEARANARDDELLELLRARYHHIKDEIRKAHETIRLIDRDRYIHFSNLLHLEPAAKELGEVIKELQNQRARESFS